MSSPGRFLLLSQRGPIVIEFGSQLTKFGFAGEAAPVAIVPSFGPLSNGKSVRLLDPKVEYSLRVEALTNFTKNVYTRILLANAKDRKVTIILNPFVSQDVERAILTVFLKILEVPSVCLVAPHMTILPALGTLHTGLIIDVGNTTKIIPVSVNAAIVGAWEVLPNIGFAGLVRYVKTFLVDNLQVLHSYLVSPDPEIDDAEIIPSADAKNVFASMDVEKFCQDLIDRRIVCTPSSRAKRLLNGEPYSENFRPFPDAKVNIQIENDQHELIINGRFLEEAMETFFQPDIDGQTLPNAVLDAIIKCPIDIRTAMTQHILVVGGLADIRNLVPRLNAELQQLVATDYFAVKLPNAKFRFISVDNLPSNMIAWRGAYSPKRITFPKWRPSREKILSYERVPIRFLSY